MGFRREAALPGNRIRLAFVSGSTPIAPREEPTMATYECSSCGMSVNATLTRDDGSTVQVSKCPNDHGKIKSPMCCGADMSCAVG